MHAQQITTEQKNRANHWLKRPSLTPAKIPAEVRTLQKNYSGSPQDPTLVALTAPGSFSMVKEKNDLLGHIGACDRSPTEISVEAFLAARFPLTSNRPRPVFEAVLYHSSTPVYFTARFLQIGFGAN